jgi:hypothetical protein
LPEDDDERFSPPALPRLPTLLRALARSVRTSLVRVVVARTLLSASGRPALPGDFDFRDAIEMLLAIL